MSYRAGGYKPAIELLKQSLHVETKPGAAVLNWLWLAMAYQRTGDTDEARVWLKKAEDWLDSVGDELPANAESATGLHRHNWLEANVLLREAELAIGSSRGR